MFLIYIINKAGGLIFQQDLSSNAPQFSSNEHLRLASTFHSMYAIATLISPVSNSGGIEVVEGDSFVLKCFQTPTGTKFCLLASTSSNEMDAFLKWTYEIYADYVLKNPFYEHEMPIRCSLFTSKIKQLKTRFDKRRVVDSF